MDEQPSLQEVLCSVGLVSQDSVQANGLAFMPFLLPIVSEPSKTQLETWEAWPSVRTGEVKAGQNLSSKPCIFVWTSL